ncbi:metal ABC transporter solute-binding protein, Zn/Mn family [Halorubrum vacuolatum]|uniref:metal ABC transporter solute-binding protein, Zn/Mn family n=1 Tax=Halorubrum vacuolatum TaxID=63740 RepID=UPI001C528824|nr:zinc ABC transporter substrate-binding protein [Halorubrum vacuolatum]
MAASSTIGGCLESPTDAGGDGEHAGSAAFFTLQDWSNHVAGDVMAFDTPVEVGEMGHGWDPDGDIVPQIAQNDLFVYLETPEFQWAVDVADDFANDDDLEITLIDAMGAVSESELLSFTGGDELLPDPDMDADFDPSTFRVGTFELIHNDEVAAWWHDDHWHGGVPDVPVDGGQVVSINVEDTDGNVPPLGEEEQFQVDARVEDGAPDGVVDIDVDGRDIEFRGIETGQTLIVFELRADDEVVFDTAAEPTVITVDEPEAIEVDAFYDPHIWVDPVHAKAVVELLADEFATVMPDAEDTFRANAEEYIEKLDDVDRAFEELVSNAELDVAVFASHDSFQYVENRYGFELQTPVGVTPDAAESLEDVSRLAQTVEEHDIDTILFDPFEAPNPDEDIPQAATVLLEETRAEEALPLSPAEGTTPNWEAEGYGWIEQMEEVNLPSLRRALKAE